jgi:hypothetical protein
MFRLLRWPDRADRHARRHDARRMAEPTRGEKR